MALLCCTSRLELQTLIAGTKDLHRAVEIEIASPELITNIETVTRQGAALSLVSQAFLDLKKERCGDLGGLIERDVLGANR